MRLSSDIAAVVTGGASGLGEATARALAQAGVKVALFDMNAVRGEQVAGELGGVFCQVNVTSDEEVAAGFDKARAAHGQERILVNCAGIAIGQKTVARAKDTGEIKPHDIAAFERVIRINLIGSFRCASLAAAGMMAAEPLEDGERGVIVNTASVAADEGQIGQVAYAASKGGIVGLTLPAARDLASLGIRVVTIAPGLFDTPLLAALPQEAREALGAGVPFPSRLGQPAEYAELVAAIVENPMLNGETIRLDGALRMPPK